MPLYGYKCDVCGKSEEELRKSEDRENYERCEELEIIHGETRQCKGSMVFQPVQKTSFRMQGFEKNG
jgi:putative FmdB family regulatory protein